ncbi:DUF4362 domain-containing protein [Micromonospora purpureochromogenes]|uniref:DUF4362 domain-containing protein n=1 Tax=Micromonospora purpureochromogenes TaxID=47872 RepID=UPI0036395DF4
MGKTRAIALALLLAVAACAPADGAPTASPPTTAAPPSAASPTAVGPDAPRDCGTWTVEQGEELTPRAGACLGDALRDRLPARLVVTAPTVEGDPITTSYLTRPDGRVEVTTDARRDRFGSRRVERQICDGPPIAAGLPVFGRCSTPQPV